MIWGVGVDCFNCSSRLQVLLTTLRRVSVCPHRQQSSLWWCGEQQLGTLALPGWLGCWTRPLHHAPDIAGLIQIQNSCMLTWAWLPFVVIQGRASVSVAAVRAVGERWFDRHQHQFHTVRSSYDVHGPCCHACCWQLQLLVSW